jgi:hypothetical protein
MHENPLTSPERQASRTSLPALAESVQPTDKIENHAGASIWLVPILQGDMFAVATGNKATLSLELKFEAEDQSIGGSVCMKLDVVAFDPHFKKMVEVITAIGINPPTARVTIDDINKALGEHKFLASIGHDASGALNVKALMKRAEL